jgi:predicted  nucleic acid-binding Zn-ribbon protein
MRADSEDTMVASLQAELEAARSREVEAKQQAADLEQQVIQLTSMTRAIQALPRPCNLEAALCAA